MPEIDRQSVLDQIKALSSARNWEIVRGDIVIDASRYPQPIEKFADDPSVSWSPVAELIDNNLAWTIPNPEVILMLLESYDPDNFWPIERVSVRPAQVDPRQTKIRDGLNRLYFANLAGWPTIPGVDVTKAAIRTVRGQKATGPDDALTTSEFWRLVIPPVIQYHEHIAGRRTAAIVLEGWDDFMPPELAQKFTALSGLSLLTMLRQRRVDVQTYAESLANQPFTAQGESEEERNLILTALNHLEAAIQGRSVTINEVYRSALNLVLTADPVIGGTEVALREIMGLIHLPQVTQKLEQAYPGNELLQITALDGFRTLLTSVLGRRQAGEPVDMGIIVDACKDLKLTWPQLEEVAVAHDTREKFEDIKWARLYDEAATYYRKQLGLDPSERLLEIEERLLTNLVSHYEKPDVITRQIRKIIPIYLDARDLLTKIKDTTATPYLTDEDRTEWEDSLNLEIKKIEDVSSIESLGMRRSKLDELISRIQSAIYRIQYYHEAGMEVEDIIGSHLREKVANIADESKRFEKREQLIITTVKAVKADNLPVDLSSYDYSTERERLEIIASLDADLREAIIDGRISSVEYAETLQRARQEKSAPPPAIPATEEPPAAVRKIPPRDTTPTTPVKPTVATEPQPKISMEIEQQRSLLTSMLNSLLSLAERITLKRNQIGSETRASVARMINFLANLYFDEEDMVDKWQHHLDTLAKKRATLEEEVAKDSIRSVSNS